MIQKTPHIYVKCTEMVPAENVKAFLTIGRAVYKDITYCKYMSVHAALVFTGLIILHLA
jgi:hypothetical protein